MIILAVGFVPTIGRGQNILTVVAIVINYAHPISNML